MTKNEFKKFIKDHKKEIAIGVGTVIFGGAVFIITRKKLKLIREIDQSYLDEFVSKSVDVKLFEEMCEAIDEVREGSKMYVPIIKDDLVEMFDNDRPVFEDPNGALLEVTGGIFFGNEVKK